MNSLLPPSANDLYVKAKVKDVNRSQSPYGDGASVNTTTHREDSRLDFQTDNSLISITGYEDPSTALDLAGNKHHDTTQPLEEFMPYSRVPRDEGR